MLYGGRYLYVGFMCQQTIEKALKAVITGYCEEGEVPPKIHDLGKLAVREKCKDIYAGTGELLCWIKGQL